MTDKYDGWTIKDLRSGKLLFRYLSHHRTSCVDKHIQLWGKGAWQKIRIKKIAKLVKVKLVEVTNTCQKTDRDVPKLICGYPLPCPHHKEGK